MLPTIPEAIAFRRLDSEAEPWVVRLNVEGRSFARVRPEALTRLARAAFREVNFFLRSRRLEELASILDDPEASEGDRLVARMAIDNAVLSARGQLP
ncbi:MAG: fumarate hydratase, partial [Myxococcaceae bacterium]|nr:fumarate hydratase [Myxococcaceae bacterium]